MASFAWRRTTHIPFKHAVDTLESVDYSAWTSLCSWLKSFFSAPERGFSVSTQPVFFPQHNQGSPQELSKSSLTAQFNDSPLTNSIPMKHRHSPGNRVLLCVKLESRFKRRKKDSSLPSKKIKPLPGGCASPSLPHLFIFKMAFHSQLLMRSHAVCPSSHLSSRLSVTHKVKVVAMNYSPPLEPHSRSRSRFFCSFNWVSEDNNEDNISLIKQRGMVFKKLRWMKDKEVSMVCFRGERRLNIMIVVSGIGFERLKYYFFSKRNYS